jgi:carbon-monoxide dehydrogenase medium subunit
VKPAPFIYHAPGSVDEAITLLAEAEDEVKILAGGQSLIPILNMRLAQPSALVDICTIPGLDRIERNGQLTIGATARQSEVLRSAAVGEYAPIIPAALRWVGHTANRNQGTFGGSAAHADPAAELPAVLLALDAEMVVQGPGGQRVINAEDFFSSIFTTALESDEVLTAVRVPRPTSGGGGVWAFREVARRHGDFALAGVALVADLDSQGQVSRARIALCGVADRPVRAGDAERFLVGRRLDDAAVAREAGALASAGVNPGDDGHASGLYRKEAVAALVARAVSEAASRAEARR